MEASPTSYAAVNGRLPPSFRNGPAGPPASGPQALEQLRPDRRPGAEDEQECRLADGELGRRAGQHPAARPASTMSVPAARWASATPPRGPRAGRPARPGRARHGAPEPSVGAQIGRDLPVAAGPGSSAGPGPRASEPFIRRPAASRSGHCANGIEAIRRSAGTNVSSNRTVTVRLADDRHQLQRRRGRAASPATSTSSHTAVVVGIAAGHEQHVHHAPAGHPGRLPVQHVPATDRTDAHRRRSGPQAADGEPGPDLGPAQRQRATAGAGLVRAGRRPGVPPRGAASRRTWWTGTRWPGSRQSGTPQRDQSR